MGEFTLHEAQREAARQSERQLEGQLTLAVASDQRALALCATLLVVIVFLLERSANRLDTYFDILPLAPFALGAGLSAYAAWPTRFYGSGGSYGGFRPYLNEHYFNSVIDAIGERNDFYILENNVSILKTTRITKSAFIISLGGVVMLAARVIMQVFGL